MARITALIYNSWGFFIRLANPDQKRSDHPAAEEWNDLAGEPNSQFGVGQIPQRAPTSAAGLPVAPVQRIQPLKGFFFYHAEFLALFNTIQVNVAKKPIRSAIAGSRLNLIMSPYIVESISASRSSRLQTVARALILAVGIFPFATKRQNVAILMPKYSAADLGRR
ncbi:MAG: hypothetical protein Q7V32_18540 [Methylicorpusculum sp.]|nr:hypothetical protein [Methylicorpusculum sp.]MDO8846334.1 hypothetical protein [Methylicorpusculum sp.]